MSYFLAIDAGGTKTDYVLADESRELARTRSGTIKRMRTDAETATANLEAALENLTAQSGVSMDAVTQTCIGTAGETVPLVTDFLQTELSARVAGGLLILGDVEIALDAAFPGKAGVLVLAGTGSNIAGRTAAGKLVNAGGWGPALADQGSGHRIGLAALRAAFFARDQGRETSIFDAVYDFWHLRSGSVPPLDQLVAHANAIPAPDFSRLVPLVLECARKGDGVAVDVLAREGEDLAVLTRLVINRILVEDVFADDDAEDQADDDTEDKIHPSAALPPIAFAGSIMERVQPVRDALVRAVEGDFPGIVTVPGVVDPVLGALYRARAVAAKNTAIRSVAR